MLCALSNLTLADRHGNLRQLNKSGRASILGRGLRPTQLASYIPFSTVGGSKDLRAQCHLVR